MLLAAELSCGEFQDSKAVEHSLGILALGSAAEILFHKQIETRYLFNARYALDSASARDTVIVCGKSAGGVGFHNVVELVNLERSVAVRFHDIHFLTLFLAAELYFQLSAREIIAETQRDYVRIFPVDKSYAAHPCRA